MTLTLTQVLGGVLQYLGILDSGGAANISAQQLADALLIVNQLIDNKSADRLMAAAALVTNVTLGSGTQSYAIGSGQTINIARPTMIEAASIKLANGYTAGIKVVNAAEWSMLRNRDRQSYLVKYLFYDRGSPTTGTVKFSPIPLGGTAEIITWTAMTQFADATTPITMAPAYSRWLILAAAFELAPTYPSAQVPSTFLQDYADATATLRNANASLFGVAPPSSQIASNNAPPAPIAPAPAEAA